VSFRLWKWVTKQGFLKNFKFFFLSVGKLSLSNWLTIPQDFMSSKEMPNTNCLSGLQYQSQFSTACIQSACSQCVCSDIEVRAFVRWNNDQDNTKKGMIKCRICY
jgi:hypothetical protein